MCPILIWNETKVGIIEKCIWLILYIMIKTNLSCEVENL